MQSSVHDRCLPASLSITAPLPVYSTTIPQTFPLINIVGHSLWSLPLTCVLFPYLHLITHAYPFLLHVRTAMSQLSSQPSTVSHPPTALQGPYLRYTRGTLVQHNHQTNPHHFAEVNGWLVKQGKKSKQSFARYFRLRNDLLSNHRDAHAVASWTVSLVDAVVQPGLRPQQISVRHQVRKLTLFAASRKDFLKWLFALRRASAYPLSLSALYQTGDVIGDGISGEILSGRDRLNGEAVAIKSLPLTNEQGQLGNTVTEEEISIAISLNHPNLVRTYDVFRDTTSCKADMVMEFVAGGELRSRVDGPEESLVGEKDAVRVARNLLSALNYLHNRGIVHRDVKLENVLCVDVDERKPLRVKLADFGSSTTVDSNRTTLNSEVGTGFYMAPELIRKEPYGRAVDIWALGVLLYVTLSCQMPFVGMETEEYFQNVLTQPLEFPEEFWSKHSAGAQDFIRRLMDKNAKSRITAQDALKHPWIANSSDDNELALEVPWHVMANDGNEEELQIQNIQTFSLASGDDEDDDSAQTNECASRRAGRNNGLVGQPVGFVNGDGGRAGREDAPRSLLFGRRRTPEEILAKKMSRQR